MHKLKISWKIALKVNTPKTRKFCAKKKAHNISFNLDRKVVLNPHFLDSAPLNTHFPIVPHRHISWEHYKDVICLKGEKGSLK
jgi:hypothetical protein